MSPVMSRNQPWEVVIIGAGPAGLAAATSVCRAARRVCVFDSHQYRNQPANEIHNVVMHAGQQPDRFRSLSRQEIWNCFEHDITFIEATISNINKVHVRDGQTGFELTDNAGNTYRGKKLVIATGSMDLMPNIPGYRDLFGHGM